MTERKAKAKATTKTTAGPSAPLRFAQDDGICFCLRERNGRFLAGMIERGASAKARAKGRATATTG
jgi:hypothetical protein